MECPECGNEFAEETDDDLYCKHCDQHYEPPDEDYEEEDIEDGDVEADALEEENEAEEDDQEVLDLDDDDDEAYFEDDQDDEDDEEDGDEEVEEEEDDEVAWTDEVKEPEDQIAPVKKLKPPRRARNALLILGTLGGAYMISLGILGFMVRSGSAEIEGVLTAQGSTVFLAGIFLGAFILIFTGLIFLRSAVCRCGIVISSGLALAFHILNPVFASNALHIADLKSECQYHGLYLWSEIIGMLLILFSLMIIAVTTPNYTLFGPMPRRNKGKPRAGKKSKKK